MLRTTSPTSFETDVHQPFGQVPCLTDGDISIFERGAILLHLGIPAHPRGRSEATQWVLAALNSAEMA
jgi:glutathione S-transferase